MFTPFTTTLHDERQGYVSLRGVMQPSIRSMFKGRFCFGREVDGGCTTQYDVELKYRMGTFLHELHTLFFISIAIPLLIVATGVVVLTDPIADRDELLSSFWGDLYPVTLTAVFVLVLVPVGVMLCRSKPQMGPTIGVVSGTECKEPAPWYTNERESGAPGLVMAGLSRAWPMSFSDPSTCTFDACSDRGAP